MMQNLYENNVIKSILANNQYDIRQVSKLCSIANGIFTNETYDQVKQLIKEGRSSSFNGLMKDQPDLPEFLDVLTFKNK